MGGLREEIVKKLPEGAVVGGIYKDPADETKIIIEYILDNKVNRVTPERVNVATLFDYEKGIALVDGLTYNDVYEIVSKRYGLNFIKGIDYIDNQEEITEAKRYRLPINDYSLRFTPGGFNVDIIKLSTAILGDEKERNLTDLVLLPMSNFTVDQLRYLALNFHDLKNIKCFEGGQITIAFRQAIAETIDTSLPDLKKEILSSYLLKGYSDILSDVVLLVGPSEIPFIIRYESAEGDVP